MQWKETNSGQLMDSKLRCVFVLDENSSGDVIGSGGGGSNSDGHEYSTAKADIAAVKTLPVTASPKVQSFTYYSCTNCKTSHAVAIFPNHA